MRIEMRHEARQVPSWLIFDVGQNMSSQFHRIDFFRVALQARGASPIEIEEILVGIRKLGGAKFDAWNRPMTERDQQVLAMILGPQGQVLAAELLEGFKKEIVARWGISEEEMRRFLKSRFLGLN